MRRNKKTEDSGFNVWRSYSDMMAGVLLLFVLIMSVTLFQAQENYKKSLKEQQEKIAIQDAYITKVLEQQTALEEKESLIASQDETIKSQDEELAMRERMLAELAAKLDEQQAQLLEQQAQLDTQSRTLKSQEQQLGLQAQRIATQETSLNAKTAQLQEQQQKIDNIIGVKAEVVEALRQEFARNNVSVDIDAQTGALTLDANVMFEVAESELTDEGERALSRILPIYCRVLLNQDYKQYLAEIIIDGYTDTAGSYEYNLELSQQRSLAVAQYLLDIMGDFLTYQQEGELRNYLTVNGHSYSNPILDANGNVDMDASRRVEVKFRLKDDEMIQELNNIMASQRNG